MTTDIESEIAGRRAALANSEEAHFAAAEALRICEEAKATADTAYAGEQTPKTRKALRDARDDLDDAKVVAEAAIRSRDTARAELEQAVKRDADDKYAAFQREVVSLDAIHQRFAPLLERACGIRDQEIELGRDIDAEFVALRRDFEAAGALARAAGQNTPRLSFTVDQLREMVIRRLRGKPFPSGVTNVDEMLDPQASIYAGAA